MLIIYYYFISSFNKFLSLKSYYLLIVWSYLFLFVNDHYCELLPFIILLICDYLLFSMLEAVRKIKAFENVTNCEIEGPMKI